LWDQANDSIQRRTNEFSKDNSLVTREPWRPKVYMNALYRFERLADRIKVAGPKWIGTMYFPKPIIQPFLKDIGEHKPVYQIGVWMGIPHNSEATQGELLGGFNLREVMHHNSLAQMEHRNKTSISRR